jgi:hypothetical protein
MKQLLNDMSFEERQKIREQHTGGMNVTSNNFRRLVNGKLGNSKPLISEQGNPEQKKVSSKLSEGIQNVLPQMIQSPPFKGFYSSSTFGGNFNGVDYEWIGNGVEGMSGIRGVSYGVVLTENNSYLVENNIGITDADPKGTWVGFMSDNESIYFVFYKTTNGTIKCVNNPNM